LHQDLSVESVGHPRKKEAHAQSGVRRKRLEIPMQRYERQILQGIGVCVRSFVTVVEAPHSLHLSEGNHSRTGTPAETNHSLPEFAGYRRFQRRVSAE
jgi:hypothetical protein